MINEPLSKVNYRPEIDGIRAFAVLAVIINHLNPDIFPSGYLGVDVFFVISGYVITSSLSGRQSKNFQDFLIGFYERRLKRLIPALIFFVLVTSLLICVIHPAPGFSLWLGIYSLFGISNFELVNQSTDYFAPPSSLNVFMHTWSLGVEEQFYFVFPILIWCTGFGRQVKNGKNNLIILTLFLSIFSLITFIYFYKVNQPAAYFLMPFRFWELSSGCLLFLFLDKKVLLLKKLEKIPPLLILGLMIGIMFLPVSLGIQSTICIILLTIMLLISLKKGSLAFSIFSTKKVVYVGLISYSLYLWHYGVISLSKLTFGINWWTIPFQIVLIFALASFSHKYIETPIRSNKWSINKLRTLLVTISLLMLSAFFILFIGFPSNRKYLYVGKFSFDNFNNIQETYNFTTGDDLGSYNKNVDGSAVYIFGDSHAFNHFPSIKKVAKKYNFNKFFYAKSEYLLPNFILNQISNDDLLVFSVKAYNYNQNEFRKNLEFLINISKNSGAKLILVDDLTPFGENQDADFFPKFSFYGNGPTISRLNAEKRRSKHTKNLIDYVDNINVFYIDPLPKVCDLKLCSAVINGSLIYADGSPHVNSNGSIILNDFWRENLPQLLDLK